MISKQFLVTAVFMGIIAVMLSVFFRLQLGWPERASHFETFLASGLQAECWTATLTSRW